MVGGMGDRRTLLCATGLAAVLAATMTVPAPIGAVAEPTSAVPAPAASTPAGSGAALGALAAQSPQPAPPAGRDLITQQYLDFLGREPDEAGLVFWNHQLDSGVHPAALIQSMAEQPEFEQVVAPLVRLYVAYFRRTPDIAGLEFWIGRIRAGQGIDSISENFAQSSEFRTTYGSLDDTGFIELVYRNVLGRAADDGGRSYWLAQMSKGVDRGAVMTAFSESEENRRATYGEVRSTMLYVGMLDRSPEATGLAYWADLIDSGVPYADVIAGFLESTEYRERVDRLLPERNPLTGEATRDAPDRTALAVKIDNVPRARPQVGLNQADVVVEEKVEGDLTRLIAIFQSDVPSIVGPVRSIRTTDFDVLAQFDNPMLAASGANATVLRLLESAPVQNVNALVGGAAYYRDTSRSAPHNLFVKTAELYPIATDPTSTPPMIFRYRPTGQATANAAGASAGVDLAFGGTDVSYRWDGRRGGWVRRQDGVLHTEPGGAQIVPENVVVMTVDYAVSVADAESPEAITVGQGRVDVFTNGVRVTGTWKRSTATDRLVFTDGTGSEIVLTPGETWIALAPAGSVTIR